MKLDATKRGLLLGGLVVGAIGMVATAAKAGFKQDNPVSITSIFYDPNTGVPVPATQVTGSLGSTRASADATQYIGCSSDYDANIGGGLGTVPMLCPKCGGNKRLVHLL